ncbi:MAG: helix-turn-helix transcriptional regulator [Bacteroidota bacterium]
MQAVIHIPSIHELHQAAGVAPPNHPLFSIHRLQDLAVLSDQFPGDFTYGFYSVGLKKNLGSFIKYGRTQYDFQEGTLGFTAPNQRISFDPNITETARGWVLFFHKDLGMGTPFNEKLDRYGFFDYDVSEGLHLSHKEEDAINQLFANILTEYQYPIDQHSRQVVLSNIELMLTYSERYYKRQFVVRNDANPALLNQFERELNRYFQAPAEGKGLPTVEHFANELNLSPKYLSDLLKSLTGKTALEHIHYQLIELAKNRLLGSEASISEIAYGLGFEYPQYFSRLFRKKTGMSPKAFRMQHN